MMPNVQYLLTADEWESEVCFIGWRVDGQPITQAADLAGSMLAPRRDVREEHGEEAISYRLAGNLEEVTDWLSEHGVREDETVTFWDGPFHPAGLFTLNPDQQLAFKIRWL